MNPLDRDLSKIKSRRKSEPRTSAGLLALLSAVSAGALLHSSAAFAACGASTYTWDGSSSNFWSVAANWTPGTVPNSSTSNATIVGAANTAVLDISATVGCLTIGSGGLGYQGTDTLTVTGDYFTSTSSNSMASVGGGSLTILMAGTAAQTLTVNDPIPNVTISNNTSVTLNAPFSITGTLSITGTGTTVHVNSNLSLTGALTIPASATVEVGSGATLTALGGITVNGTLKLDAGATVLMGSGKTLSVPSTGSLIFNASSGNAAVIDAYSGTYSLTVAGTLYANWFKVSHTTAAGLSVSGTVQRLDNGEFHYPTASGYNMTIAAGTTLPSTSSGVSFYNDAAAASVSNFNVTAYTGSVLTLSSWAGGIGGATHSNPVSSAKLSWGTQAAVAIALSNATASGSPPSGGVAANSGPTVFATFAFALNQASTSTDITSITFTQYGTGASSDIDYIQVFKDNGTCAYAAGEVQIGSNLTLSGSPATATVTIPAATVSVSGTTQVCVHVRAHISATAQTGDTLGFKINSTADVTNSQGYSFSSSSGPPVSAPTTSVTGGQVNVWLGTSNTVWTTTGNWYPGSVAPAATNDCKIAGSTNIPVLSASQACQNATLPSGGSLSFGGGAYTFGVHGALSVASGFTFTTATAGTLSMAGAANQSFIMSTAFPGTVTIANTGAAGNNIVSVDSNSTIGGNLTISGGILKIPSGSTLNVNGNVTVASGGTLEIDGGGILKFGTNGSTLTVASGGTLQLVGSVTQSATITTASTATAFTAAISGTIKANYYSVSRLGAAGFTINSTATIDPTNYLLNGSFSYPVANATTLLTLNTFVPPAAASVLSGMTFDSGGSAATGTMGLKTNYNNANRALTISSYTGSLSGPTYTTVTGVSPNIYPVTWTGATNTINLTQNSTGASTFNQGTTYTMGRFGFQQTQAGAFSNANITSLKITMTGTGSASDVSAARIYYDAACNGTGLTLLGTGTFSGNPATITFSSITGASIPFSVSAPALVCIDVQYDVSSTATAGDTLGVEIAGMTDVVNDQAYAISNTTPTPITLGTPGAILGTSTSWTGGAATTAWCTAGNWSNGLPTSALNCVINNATNLPVISAQCPGPVWPVCKSVTINSGSLTINAATELDVYGSFASNGTFTQNGTLRFMDTGVASNQTMQTASNSFGTVTFTKTLGGTIGAVGSAVTIGTLTIPAGSNFTYQVPGAQTLTLTNGLTLPAATFQVQSGGTLALPNGQGITVNGGTFQTSGTNDVFPQTLTNKATVTVSGAGTWAFTATSGTVDLTGFILDYIGVNGLSIGGTTTLSNLNGGQFTHLSQTYASIKPIQLNTTGTIPATASNIGWNWGAANGNSSTYVNPPDPTPATTYLLAYSSGCGNQTISFSQWFGDFYTGVNSPNPQTKVTASSCTITISTAASPVSLLSFQAAGYNGAVAVDWMTGSELQHQGFNVYRSATPSSGFAQLNSSLIRNTTSYWMGHGQYHFIDPSAANGVTYFYLLEDVAIDGTRQLHGPVSATPSATAGTVPATSSGSNAGSASPGAGNSDAGGTGSNPANAGAVNLGNGVTLLARTRDSIRLKILPPAASFSASSWNPSYESVAVAGYSSTLLAGQPELAERTLLVEVDPSAATATVSASQVAEGPSNTHLIQPAPLFSPDGSGQLLPSTNPDAQAYSTNAFSPLSYFRVDGTIIHAGGRSFVKVIIDPLSYNAATHQLKEATLITLDIGLNGQAWNGGSDGAVAPAVPQSASAQGDVLRIRYRASGLYELGYDDIAATGLDGPFAGVDPAKLRLYYRGTEIPIDVLSAGGVFHSGDRIRFYGYFTATNEDTENEVVLSQRALLGENTAALRVGHLNGDPTGLPANSDAGTLLHGAANVDLYPMFDQPLGSGADHFYWGLIYRAQGSAPDGHASLTMPIDLPALNPGSGMPVNLQVVVQGGAARAANATHHLGVWVNDVPYMVADKTFAGTATATLSFSLPASYFVPGANRVIVQILGDQVPTGDTDIAYIDRAEADYYGYLIAVNGSASLNLRQPDSAVRVTGFTSGLDVVAYDATNLNALAAIDLPQPSAMNGGTAYEATFANRSGPNGLAGRKIVIADSSSLLKPSSLALGYGYANSLRSIANAADLLLIGPDELLQAAAPLIAARRQQGLRVATASLNQIYDEFSNGIQSSAAIRDFVQVAQATWSQPAFKYLLFLGDGTYDPRDRLGYGSSRSVMPMYLEQGLWGDFGDDNWFVSSASDDATPTAAVGRIPTRDPAVLDAYIAKLLSYEAGAGAPAADGANRLVFVSDAGQYGEMFAQRNQALASAAVASQARFRTSQIDRGALPDDASTRSAILAAFGQSPLFLTYLGHGAEDRWAADTVFANADASQLANGRLPIVVGLNCLNSAFYYPDPAYQTLGESLVLNPAGGAIAFLGSTTETDPATQTALGTNLLNEIGQQLNRNSPDARLGDFILRAKLALGNSPATTDTLRSFSLFGDPSMPLPQAAYTQASTAASDKPASASKSEDSDSHGHGFLSCGTTQGPGKGGPPPGGPLVLVLTLAMLYALSHPAHVRRLFIDI